MASKQIRLALAAVAVLISSLMLSACGGESAPQDREFSLGIIERKLNLDPPVVKVDQGDKVTLSINADEHGTFHLHGYDIEIEVGPEEAGIMEFSASATGNFSITFHPGGEEDAGDGGEHEVENGEEINIASLQVHPR